MAGQCTYLIPPPRQPHRGREGSSKNGLTSSCTSVINSCSRHDHTMEDAMTTYSFDELERRAIQTGGLLEVSMETLRDMVGAGKLGAHVRDEIRRGLKRRNLVILGGKLPGEQRSTVW